MSAGTHKIFRARHGICARRPRREIHSRQNQAAPENRASAWFRTRRLRRRTHRCNAHSYEKIPGFPRSTAIGHAGRLVIGKVGNIAVAAMQGRVHFYEGYTAQEVAFPMRVLGRSEFARRFSPTPPAASICNTARRAGRHQRSHQSAGHQSADWPERRALRSALSGHDPSLLEALSRNRARRSQESRYQRAEGVYAALAGPNYETPAEIRYLRTIGADLVGMSTVPETIAARHMGIRVLGISCVTNMAAGILDQVLDHTEVLETGERVKGQFIALLRAVLPRIAADTIIKDSENIHERI